jgi:hypothetical protein
MIISIAIEKACDTEQHPFMIKALKKLGALLNIIKAFDVQTIVNSIFSGKYCKPFLQIWEPEKGIYILTNFI